MDEVLPQKNWWQRNWKWALPTGGCLVVLVLIVVFVVSLVTGVSALFKESKPYQTALTKAQESEWVIEQLGEPIEVSGIAQGNINYSGNQGTADLKIPVKGPKNSGEILVWGDKSGDEWAYKYIRFRVSGSEQEYDLINNRLLSAESD